MFHPLHFNHQEHACLAFGKRMMWQRGVRTGECNHAPLMTLVILFHRLSLKPKCLREGCMKRHENQADVKLEAQGYMNVK